MRKLSIEKIQSIFNDELTELRKELKSKNKIINKLLETIENISNKAVQLNPRPIQTTSLRRWLKWYERFWEKRDQSTRDKGSK